MRGGSLATHLAQQRVGRVALGHVVGHLLAVDHDRLRFDLHV